MDEKMRLVDNIMEVIPLLHRKMFSGLRSHTITKHQVHLLRMIEKHSCMPMKFYCEKMMIPKSNFTKLYSGLIDEGYIERAADEEDRRVIRLLITKKGRDLVEKHREIMRNEFMKKLSDLSEAETELLNSSIENIMKIIQKIR